MNALPMPPRKVTELEPLPEHPPQVNVPKVLNVTGSALASDIPSDETTRSNALMKVALKRPFMVLPSVTVPCASRSTALSKGAGRGARTSELTGVRLADRLACERRRPQMAEPKTEPQLDEFLEIRKPGAHLERDVVADDFVL